MFLQRKEQRDGKVLLFEAVEVKRSWLQEKEEMIEKLLVFA